MSLFHGYNEIPKPKNPIVMTSSPSKTTIFNLKGSKPKGLSMRSNSDMNICPTTRPTNIKENAHASKELKISKPKIIIQNNSGQQHKEHLKFSNHEYRNTEFEGLTPKGKKKDTNKSKETNEISDNAIFKKPLPAKKFVNQMREPENLAHIYDAEHEIDYKHIETVEQDFIDQYLKRKTNLKPYEKKDSKTLLSLEIPELIFPSSDDEEYMELPSPELPYISDDDNL